MKAVIQSVTNRTMNSSNCNHQNVPQPPELPVLIKKKELAKRLSVSPHTVDAWVLRGEIPCIKISTRLYLYEFDAVMAALRKNYGTNGA
jgi:excisionase family DNA binding protein